MRSGAPEAREQVQWTCESDERRELGRAAVPSPAHVRKTVGGRGWSGAKAELGMVPPEFQPYVGIHLIFCIKNTGKIKKPINSKRARK